MKRRSPHIERHKACGKINHDCQGYRFEERPAMFNFRFLRTGFTLKFNFKLWADCLPSHPTNVGEVQLQQHGFETRLHQSG